MHEYSIVQALLTQCEDIAAKNDANAVNSIEIKIGVMSGVESHLLKTAFDTFKEGTVCGRSQLIIHEQPLKILCNECGFESEVPVYKCSKCESLNVKVVDGEDMYLMRLEME
ncbi:MAG: hydrogenase maturation nickel metallochaperone HypA [Sulfurovaceae bacterium]|nr:hydrogenase maturation nickel metallochaperone HypA [Sulfurovaceae bacterium]